MRTGDAGYSFSRQWAMPSSDTFSVPPIRDFVLRHLHGVSVDPFARNSRMATHTNDLNPATEAGHHMEAIDFLGMLASEGVVADVVLFDPPYSPRQISECYASAGITATMVHTQISATMKRCKAAIAGMTRPSSLVLSFGWNSCGMGPEWELIELMLCAHGGTHNDTICMAERRVVQQGVLTYD